MHFLELVFEGIFLHFEESKEGFFLHFLFYGIGLLLYVLLSSELSRKVN
jgi:hypothetical protein